MSYRITSDIELGSHPVSEGEDEETGNLEQSAKSLKERQQPQQHKRPKRLKKTYRAPQGFFQVHSKGEGSQPTSQPV